jgi:hypothetical protein
VEEQWGRRCPPSCIAGALPRRHGGGQREAHGGGSRRCRHVVEDVVEDADAELVVMEVDAHCNAMEEVVEEVDVELAQESTWSSSSCLSHGVRHTKNVIPILVLIRIIDQHHKKYMCYYKSFFT